MLWAALAALNLSAGVLLTSQPNRMTDLESIMSWGHSWLVGRIDVYHPVDSGTDYPPHALVLLSPLGLLPLNVGVMVWASANLCLTLLAPYLAARFYRPDAPFRVILLPILMFLCWGGARTLLQFSMLALTLSMAALVLSDRRPIASGVLLGLALMKPQVALPVFCWAMFTRRARTAATALAVIVAGFAIYCLWAEADPFFVIRRYIGILARYHTGEAILVGASELRPVISRLVADVSDVDAIAGSIGLGLFAGISVAGFLEGGARTRILYAAPPLVACWSLVTFYHLTYGFVVLLPVLMLLALNDTERSPLRKMLFWVLQLGLMFDVPGIARRAGLSADGLLGIALSHADRVLILVLLAGLVVLAWEEPALPGNPRPAQQHVS
jgi:hypothetical protein